MTRLENVPGSGVAITAMAGVLPPVADLLRARIAARVPPGALGDAPRIAGLPSVHGLIAGGEDIAPLIRINARKISGDDKVVLNLRPYRTVNPQLLPYRGTQARLRLLPAPLSVGRDDIPALVCDAPIPP